MNTQAQTMAQALAEQVGKAMYAVDIATKDTMGITLEECAPGRATMRMEVKPLHLNGHQICHGGFIHGDTIAMFRGKSAQIQGTVIPA